MEASKRFIVAYDISQDRRRDRIAKVLETYGDRVQYSVFLVDGRPARLLRLRATLSMMMEPGDSIIIADLGPVAAVVREQRFEVLGRRRPYTGEGPLVV